MKLEEMERLCEEATRGPWECKDHPDAPFDGTYRILGPKHTIPEGEVHFDNRDWNGYFSNYGNAKFIAASRTLMPKLIAVAKAAKVLNWKSDSISIHFLEDLDRALKKLEQD